MSFRALAGVRHRVSKAAGVQQINMRLDQLEQRIPDFELESRREFARFEGLLGELELQILRQTRSNILAASGLAQQNLDTAVLQMGDHAVALARLHTEAAVLATQQGIISDLRKEMLAQADHAVARAAEHTQASVDVAMQASNRRLSFLARQIADEGSQLAGTDRRKSEAVGEDEVGATESAPKRTSRTSRPPRSDPESAEMEPWFYAALEDVFRGDEADIAKRQAMYVPYVEKSVQPERPLVDLGCGRGEWLQVLQGHGLSAFGVDSNPTFVEQCVAAGLDVRAGNLVDFLRSAEPASLGAISMFQVLEHLPFAVVAEVMKLARQALAPGGVFIAEVPNAKNVRVGSGTFWIDPTHVRPWYPDALEFVASAAGFSEVEGLYLHPILDSPNLEGVPENIAVLLGRLLDAVDGPVDYALVARVEPSNP